MYIAQLPKFVTQIMMDHEQLLQEVIISYEAPPPLDRTIYFFGTSMEHRWVWIRLVGSCSSLGRATLRCRIRVDLASVR